MAGCHLAGACPFEVLDISPWAEATFRHFLRHPYAQRLPRKFKINFSGCATDCGQAMFNDVGVVAVTRARPDGTIEAGFRVFVAGGLGATPHPALALEDFTSRDDLLATLEAIAAGLRPLRQPRQQAPGPDEVARRHPRHRRAAAPASLKERRLLLAAAGWPGGVPAVVVEEGDEPAGVSPAGFDPGAARPGAVPGHRSRAAARTPAGNGPTWSGAWPRGTVSAYAHCRLGDVTADQFDGLAALQRRFGAEVRVTNRQNVVFRGLDESQLPELHAGLVALGMGRPGAELARDVVSCPGADTCNLAVTQSRGLAVGHRRRPRRRRPGRGRRRAGQHLRAAPTPAGSTTSPTSASSGSSAEPTAGPPRATSSCSAATSATPRSSSAARRCGCPAKACAEATVRLVGRFAAERDAAETFTAWLDRAGGARPWPRGWPTWPSSRRRSTAPGFYVDFDETGPFTAEVGASECAG